LNQLLQHLYGDGGDWAWEQQAIVQALDTMQEQASECTLDLDLSVVVSILDEALSADSGRFGHRSGALTISALEPMRAIPHRLIVLMGLDSQDFPRQQERAGFHLLEQQRRLGDPSSTDQDRYVLLEALMSARQHLLISWNARDERKGEALPPAPPVQQWLTLLKDQLTPEQFERVVLEQPANPLDPRNFLANRSGSAFSSDRHHLDARLNLDRRDPMGVSKNSLGLAHPLHWTPVGDADGLDTDAVSRWLEAPQRYWLKARGLETREWSTPVEDLSALELEERQRQSLLNQSFLDQIDWLASDSSLKWEHALPGEWAKQLRGQGTLPPGAAGLLAANRLEQRWQNLQQTLLQLGPLQCESIRAESESRTVLRAGSTTVWVSAGRLQSRTALGGWFTHLIQQAAGRSTPTAVICRCDSSTKADQFQIALHWQPLDRERAQELLLSLKALAHAGAKTCWPVPPASGLARALTLNKGLEKANRAFESRWDGGFAGMGERERPEMQLCFGDHFDADNFLTDACFEEAFQALYAPMLEAQRP
jgi:exodeoxyribonuclease V gamma subunit